MVKEFEKRLITSLILYLYQYFLLLKVHFFIFFKYSVLTPKWGKQRVVKNNDSDFRDNSPSFSFYSAFKYGENYKEFLFIITICIFTDIGGYIFGKIFNGPKLTKISPKKTYAGVFGGFILSLVTGYVFWYYSFNSRILPNEELFIFIFILFISLISQIGDLVISYFKRKAKLKNTGKILPGHGGILDRIDGMIFNAFCYLIKMI